MTQQWMLEIQGNEYLLTFSLDGKCTCLDYDAAKATRPQTKEGKIAELLAAAGDPKSQKMIEHENEEFSIRCVIDPSLAVKVKEFCDLGDKMDVETEDKINNELMKMFWVQINPFLTNPLKK